MRGNTLVTRVFVSGLVATLFCSNLSFARIRIFSQVRTVKTGRIISKNRFRTRSTPVPLTPIQRVPNNHDTESSSAGEQLPSPAPRPVIEEPVKPSISELEQTKPQNKGPLELPTKEEPKRAFGRTVADAFRNRPKLFQHKDSPEPLNPNIKLFCEDPYRLVCETSLDQVNGESWPSGILPRHAQGAFASGKKILSFLTDNHFKYNDAQRASVQKQISDTQILVTGISGPMAFSNPPHVEVPPTYWNLFSVFHELGHMIDFKSTYPVDKGEVIQIIRRTSSISDIDAIERQIASKQAEITADKIAAQGFAFLADPNIRKLGYEPISSLSLLKTVKAATGFLCGSQGGEEHPSGRFRINYIGADANLRAVLGCPVSK